MRTRLKRGLKVYFSECVFLSKVKPVVWEVNYLVYTSEAGSAPPPPSSARAAEANGFFKRFITKTRRKALYWGYISAQHSLRGSINTRHRGNKTLAALKSSFKHEFLHTKISKHFRGIIHSGKVKTSELSRLLTVKNQVAASLSLPPGKYPPTSVCEPRLCAHLRSDFPSALGSLSAGVR